MHLQEGIHPAGTDCVQVVDNLNDGGDVDGDVYDGDVDDGDHLTDPPGLSLPVSALLLLVETLGNVKNTTEPFPVTVSR